MKRFILRRNRRRGATMVEFAFVAPVLLLVMFGILEYARFFYTAQVMNNAAREGARYAAVNTNIASTANVQTYVNNYLAGVGASQLVSYSPSSNISVYQADPTTGLNTGLAWTGTGWGTAVGVSVSGSYKPVLPGFLYLPGSTTISASCVMTTEAN